MKNNNNILVRGALSFEEALEVFKTTYASGGYTHKEYKSGYMISLEGSERTVDVFDTHFYDIIFEIQEFYEDYGTVNTWLDGHMLYLDVSVNILDIRDAIKFGKENNQLAIYDCATKQAIDLSILYE